MRISSTQAVTNAPKIGFPDARRNAQISPITLPTSSPIAAIFSASSNPST
jgi:hypothetical protein